PGVCPPSSAWGRGGAGRWAKAAATDTSRPRGRFSSPGAVPNSASAQARASCRSFIREPRQRGWANHRLSYLNKLWVTDRPGAAGSLAFSLRQLLNVDVLELDLAEHPVLLGVLLQLDRALPRQRLAALPDVLQGDI